MPRSSRRLVALPHAGVLLLQLLRGKRYSGESVTRGKALLGGKRYSRKSVTQVKALLGGKQILAPCFIVFLMSYCKMA